MERVGEAVARELGRYGPASGMAPLVEAWPGAVGPEIARNAWPARLARDGTLHVHTQDSIWAFELTSRVTEIAERLGGLAPRSLQGSLEDRQPSRSQKPTHSREGFVTRTSAKWSQKLSRRASQNPLNDRSFW
jgi:hypothetical protein